MILLWTICNVSKPRPSLSMHNTSAISYQFNLITCEHVSDMRVRARVRARACACVFACVSTCAFEYSFVWVRICRMHSKIVEPLYLYMYHTREDSNICYNPDIIM